MNYFEVYRDVWNYHKKLIDKISTEQEYWDTVINEAAVIVKKYANSVFVINLLLNEIDEFERIYREMTLYANRRV